MRVTHDKSVNAIYVYLVDESEAGPVTKTVEVPAAGTGLMVNVDLDSAGDPLGVEILY